jgi:hypothetical protein
MAEERWQVTVRVPMRLSDEQREQLFNRIADVVHDWEPEQRDGWDADVAAAPAGDEPLLPAVFGYDLAHRELTAEVERERSSRQAWAEEALRLEMELEQERRISSAYAEQARVHRCMSDTQIDADTETDTYPTRHATATTHPDTSVPDLYDPEEHSGFARPVCTVHEVGASDA